jgi:NAD(P)-dependent dehydrogenase (short-subunit alcohol dehydrogenase family)
VAVDLTGQVAIVTGASSGLGRQFSLVLSRSGAKVAVAGRRHDRLDEVASEIARAGGDALPVVTDVSDSADIVRLVDEVEKGLGTPTILVNSAAMPDAMYATRLPLQLIDAVIDTNLRGPFLLACEVARRLIAVSVPGWIVNISSMGAFTYSGEASALYSITKAAINRMTETLAVEWARFGINVNAIAPGAFATEMMEGMIERVGDMSVNYPRKRLGQPAQLDSTLLYLVDPSSEFVTGTIVKVDDCQNAR